MFEIYNSELKKKKKHYPSECCNKLVVIVNYQWDVIYINTKTNDFHFFFIQTNRDLLFVINFYWGLCRMLRKNRSGLSGLFSFLLNKYFINIIIIDTKWVITIGCIRRRRTKSRTLKKYIYKKRKWYKTILNENLGLLSGKINNKRTPNKKKLKLKVRTMITQLK